MKEIRCIECGWLLGKIDGPFKIKCQQCDLVNKGNADTGEIKIIRKSHIPLAQRKTSSGVTFM